MSHVATAAAAAPRPNRRPDRCPTREAFDQVVAVEWQRYVGQVAATLWQRCPPGAAVNHADAEDIVQAAMLAAWNDRHKYTGRGPLRAWLWSYVLWRCRTVHVVLMRKRQAQTIPMELDALAEPNHIPPGPRVLSAEEVADREVERERRHTTILDMIPLLPPECRSAFRAYLKTRTIAETARACKAKYTTVHARIRRGCKRLRNHFNAA